MGQATERAREVRGWARGFPGGVGDALCGGTLLGSLERHSQVTVLGRGPLGDTGEDSQGSSPRLPGETIKGEWGWGGNKCDPPAGDGDHTLDWERNRTLGL